MPSETEICPGHRTGRLSSFDRGSSGKLSEGLSYGTNGIATGCVRSPTPSRKSLNRVRRYLVARGYLSGAQRGVAAQLELTVRSGQDDERRCLEWRMRTSKRFLQVAMNPNSAADGQMRRPFATGNVGAGSLSGRAAGRRLNRFHEQKTASRRETERPPVSHVGDDLPLIQRGCKHEPRAGRTARVLECSPIAMAFFNPTTQEDSCR